jgi:hypothetical protein
MSGNALVGHLGEWPVSKYHKAHYHGPARSSSAQRPVTLPVVAQTVGHAPHTDGHEDKVIDIMGEASIYCPPGDWFHQHFNTAKSRRTWRCATAAGFIHSGFKVSHQKTDDDVSQRR